MELEEKRKHSRITKSHVSLPNIKFQSHVESLRSK